MERSLPSPSFLEPNFPVDWYWDCNSSWGWDRAVAPKLEVQASLLGLTVLYSRYSSKESRRGDSPTHSIASTGKLGSRKEGEGREIILKTDGKISSKSKDASRKEGSERGRDEGNESTMLSSKG